MATRNDPCPCGSGKKFKQCCLATGLRAPANDTEAAARLLSGAHEHFRAGRLQEAESACREALVRWPEHPAALHLLGRLACQAGRYPDGIELIGRALRIDGANAGFHNDLGLAYGALQRHDEAIACYRRALALQSGFADAHNNLGSACFSLGRLDDAASCYRRAVACRPDFAVAHYNLGVVCVTLGKLEEAVASHGEALALNRAYIESYLFLADKLINEGKSRIAEVMYKKVVALYPDLAMGHFNLGIAYLFQGELDDAATSFRKAQALKPDYIKSHISLGVTYLNQRRQADAMACFRKALEVKPDSDIAYSTMLFGMLYETYPTDELVAEHLRFAQHCEGPLIPFRRAHRNSRTPLRRLKVGYMSPDLRRHSVAHFIEPVLSNHDKTQVEVYCYYNHANHDEITERLAASSDHWIPCKEMSDEQLAERVRADGIDILVDLAGHTMGNRLLVFARKPAPVQVTYLGYPATTGLSAMDYRLTTADVDPPEQQEWYSETLYRLPESLWCYRPNDDVPPAEALPPMASLGHVTFGSMNAFPKISMETLAVWADILAAAPGARLLMTKVPEGTAREHLREWFAARGIAAERLVLHSRLAAGHYQEILRQVDIALDSFPYNGTTTTCETLWMGIPVIALSGHTSVSRSGYALLKAVGLEELAARDARDYAAIALRLASDPAELTRLRGSVRQRMISSPLRDEIGFTRNLEACYRDLWQTWCERPDALLQAASGTQGQ